MILPTKKTIQITTKNLHEIMPLLADISVDVKRQNTKRGKKHGYAPANPILFPPEYKTPIFREEDVDDLIKAAPLLPSGQVELLRYDENQMPSQISMDRRRALFELLNQGVWNYRKGKSQTFIKAGEVQNEIEAAIKSIEKTMKHLDPRRNEATQYILSDLEKKGVPLIAVRKELADVLVHSRYLGILIRKIIEAEKKQRVQRPKKSQNTGDGWYRNLTDDLCKIWVAIFERDTGTSNTKIPTTEEVEKQVRSGPLLKFVKGVLQKAGIKKSDDTIIKEIRKWKHDRVVKDETETKSNFPHVATHLSV